MTRRRSALAVAAVVAAVTACGTATAPPHPRVSLPPPAPPSLATSLATSGATWAVAELGGPAAQYDNFWQVFVRPAGSAAWRLATPPGVASNGGLVLAGMAGPSLLAGFRPSQDLTFSPLASTADDGGTWSGGVLDASLADVPDALAAAPGGGRLLALVSGGVIEQASGASAAWSRLTSVRSLAASAPGRRCAPAAPAAVSFTPSGAPVLAADCTRQGVTGIFTDTAGTWQPAAPALGASQRVQVLRLADTGGEETALLTVGAGPSAALLAAWTSDGRHWTVSSHFALGTAKVAASGFGAAGQAWVLLANGQAETIAGKGSAWHRLPQPPATSAALAFGPGGSVDALAAHGSKLTVWQLASGSATWRTIQVLDVPIQYGSSG
jgi:hypothetical protein